jgi:hypothetical protein
MSRPNRLRSGEIAVLISRIEAKGHTSADVNQLRNHLDAVGSDDVFATLMRELGEVIGASQAVSAEQRSFIESMKPILQAGNNALRKIAEQETRANDLKERALQQEEVRLARGHEKEMTTLSKLTIPAAIAIVTAIASGLGGWFAAISSAAASGP